MYKVKEQNTGVQNLALAIKKKKLHFLVREDVGKALRRIYRLRKSSKLNLEKKKKNTPLRKPTRTREDNIKMSLQGTGCEVRAEWVF
jgi:hypothetical protein